LQLDVAVNLLGHCTSPLMGDNASRLPVLPQARLAFLNLTKFKLNRS
jgi:hypothetical protein